VDGIRDYIGADSLGYLSLAGLYAAVEGDKGKSEGRGFCDACFSNKYPIAEEAPARLRQLRLISA
jgi:amidophosphoribosyltransferase